MLLNFTLEESVRILNSVAFVFLKNYVGSAYAPVIYVAAPNRCLQLFII